MVGHSCNHAVNCEAQSAVDPPAGGDLGLESATGFSSALQIGRGSLKVMFSFLMYGRTEVRKLEAEDVLEEEVSAPWSKQPRVSRSVTLKTAMPAIKSTTSTYL